MTGRPGLVLAALHWIEYLGLLGGLGSMVVRRLAANRPPIQWANPPLTVLVLVIAATAALAAFPTQA